MFTQNTPSANAALADFISAMIGRTVTHVELTANEPAADLLDELQMSFDVGVTFDGGALNLVLFRIAANMDGTAQKALDQINGRDYPTALPAHSPRIKNGARLRILQKQAPVADLFTQPACV